MTDQLIPRTSFVRHGVSLLLLASAVSAFASCSDLASASKSPTYLLVVSLEAASGEEPGTFANPLLSDVQFVTETEGPTVFNDIGRAQIRAELKNTVSTTSPTTVNAVTLTRYRVIFKRADGRNTPGVDIPYSFDGVVARTITIGSAVDVVFDLVRHQNKQEPPLRNLINGGGFRFITAIAEVTFYGHDQAGNEVSIVGSIDVQFADFGNE